MLKIGDEVVNGRQPKDRDIAMVFQSYALYPHTGRSNHRGGDSAHAALPPPTGYGRVQPERIDRAATLVPAPEL